MNARRVLSPSLLALSLCAASLATAHPEYRVTIVAPAGSYATDINSKGVVVGYYPHSATSVHAFLNRGKGLVDLGTLRGTNSAAIAINNKGQVLGDWISAGGQRRGFIYHHGSVRDIGVQPGRRTFYTDINDQGFITAYGSRTDSTGGQDGFLRAPDGRFTNIGAVPNTESEFSMTHAYALNNSNRIAGSSGPLTFPDQPLRAIVWSAGVMRDLGDFGWAPNAATAINDCGQLTGYASVPSAFFRDRVAFVYANGRMIDIDQRPASVERNSSGTGINNHGHVVGSSDHLSGFIYRGKRMQSLNALIDPRLRWNIASPQAINDSGQIAATAYRNGVQYAVRLDLIRPHLARLPDGVDTTSQAIPDAADTNAVARELARPVQQ
ncbi:HAF repeat-containing protein [Massilia sp. PAMC28688]|uniref:HAF repeat-containing protein n=1 Tax=Massilia sp. PAMC28688 TaxID=2861283 RepID=UPI001C633306|nr:HAF repeat-containing protein [Massilia sp. PAMC28688]QYF91722.1 HAF repeat-containing protein [Massilia sp. PAMC28688]